jgi:hypothetical protein
MRIQTEREEIRITSFNVLLQLDEFELLTLKNLMTNPWHALSIEEEDLRIKAIRQELFKGLEEVYNARTA